MIRWLMVVMLTMPLVATPAWAQGDGGGAGRGDGTGGGSGDRECKTLKLFDGETLVWERDAEAFAESAMTRSGGARHDADQAVMSIRSLLESLPTGSATIRRVDIAACGGRAYELRRHHLAADDGREYLLILNRRAAFKFVEVEADAREKVLVRNVGRITITRRE